MSQMQFIHFDYQSAIAVTTIVWVSVFNLNIPIFVSLKDSYAISKILLDFSNSLPCLLLPAYCHLFMQVIIYF